jgi:hypothetical protein
MLTSFVETEYLSIVPNKQSYFKKNGLSLKFYIDFKHNCVRIKGYLKQDSNIKHAIVSLDNGQKEFGFDKTKLTNEKIDIQLFQLYELLKLTIDPKAYVYDVKIEIQYF